MKSVKNPLRLGVFALILLSFALNLFAQKETPPAGGPAKPFVFPAVETYTLKNGMRVSLVQYGSVPKVQIVANIRAGSLDEKPSERWISSMVASLIKEGTTTRTSEQIARETAEMGGSLFTGAQTDKTVVGGEVLSEFDTRFLGLIADVIRNPKFAPDEMETLRANSLRELAVAKIRPGTIALEKFRQLTYPNHPYGDVFATEEIIKGYTLDGVKAYYNDNYGAQRTHLYVVGQFDGAKVKAAIEKLFGDWKKGTEARRNVPQINPKRSLTVIDRPGAPQSTIFLGMPAVAPSDADFIKFTVMNAILGGSFGSRITSNIRENKGYTYSPSSTVFNRYKTGYWYETADVTTKFTGASIKEILYEIDRLKKEPPTDAELQGIKNYMIGIYVLQNSTRAGVINQLESMNYNELDKGYIDNYIRNVNAVTPADIQEMARKYLSEDKMTIVVVGDKSVITDQLKPYQN
ncbi:MAG: insulinase family protein [Acidobacteria bacterium]|nr:insulinase family protein [Acidobacteriota bacterium]